MTSADSGEPGPAATSCPSALCEEDALLLGVVVPDGTVAYVQPPTRISADFVAQAQAAGHPERRFRFSAACREGACPQWTGTGCGVIDIVIGARPQDQPPARSAAGPGAAKPGAGKPGAGLPACGIRRTCRWFAQRGAAACAVCPQIVADTGTTATWRSWQQAAGTAGTARAAGAFGTVGAAGVAGTAGAVGAAEAAPPDAAQSGWAVPI